jgi:CheY-like chemotaxis protein
MTRQAPVVIVVEDEFLVRDMIVRELEFAGFNVLEAESAEDALALLPRCDRIDLLFTDIRLPGKNGWQLAEAVRERYREIPIIYASGYSDSVFPLAHSKFLQKPYRPSQVLQAAADLGINLPPSSAD